MLEFRLNDWRTNASILGLIRVLDHAKKPYKKNLSSIEIEREVLEGLEEDYFNYFSDSYEKDLPWYRIVSYEEEVLDFLEERETFEREDLDRLNDQIGITKDYLSRKNYSKVYEFIPDGESLEANIKELNKIKLKKKEKLEDRLDEVLQQLGLIREIIRIAKTDEGKKYIRAKGVIYSHINRSLEGVSFFNPTTKYKDVFLDYKSYFIDPLLEDLDREFKKKNPYECFSCGHKIEKIGDSKEINFVSNTGFDKERKSSYVWNHMSDILICPRCSFLFSFISAGFSHSLYEGIFINYSRSIDGLVGVNKNAESKLKNIEKGDGYRGASYRTIVAALNREYMDNLTYEERDVQIVRYKDEKYIFNILSKEAIEVIKNSTRDLRKLEKAFYIDNKNYISIYDIAVNSIFNNQNLFNLIYFLSVNLVGNKSYIGGNYNFYHVGKLININYEILRRGLGMSKLNMKTKIFFNKRDGWELRKKYLDKNKANKLEGISYRLLNALKTKNAESYMHNVITAYMHVGEIVPDSITMALESEEALGILGYAFVAGLNGESKTKNKEDEEGDDKDEE